MQPDRRGGARKRRSRSARTKRVEEALAGAFLAAGGGADPILSKSHVAILRGVSLSTLDREVRRGRFPPPEEASLRRRGWRLSTVRMHDARAGRKDRGDP
jgi:predicted DNA-binding transcriptional regulator AlpA